MFRVPLVNVDVTREFEFTLGLEVSEPQRSSAGFLTVQWYSRHLQIIYLFSFQWISFLCYSRFDHPRSLQTLTQNLASKFVVVLKGQLISKGNFSVFNSPKKRT